MAPGISPTTVSDTLWFARRPIYPAPTNFAAETTHFLLVAVVAAELSGFASRKIRTVCPLESAPHSDSRGMPPFFAARFPEPGLGPIPAPGSFPASSFPVPPIKHLAVGAAASRFQVRGELVQEKGTKRRSHPYGN